MPIREERQTHTSNHSRTQTSPLQAAHASVIRRRLAGLTVVLMSASTWAAAPNSLPQIQWIQDGLVPPVLVRGEQPSLTKLSDRMKALHVPGVSIAVIRAGKLDWARGFGVERTDGPAVTPKTLFQAASISKPVTTLAVLQLAHEKRVDLDVDVNHYLTSWTLPPGPSSPPSTVTLRELLTHSAGVTVHGFAGYPAGAPLPTLTQILDGTPPANNPPIRVDSAPGAQWRYSGGGFEIIQAILTDITGTPFPTLMRERVLQPMGMNSSTYEQPLPKELRTHVAMPYGGDGRPVEGGPHVYPELAAAGLWTTPADLSRLTIGVQHALAGSAPRVLPVGTAHGMLAPMFNQQALGFVVGGSTARKYFTHGGANAGYQSLLVAYQAGDGAVIMTNSDNGHILASEILRTIAYRYQWPDFAPPERVLNAVAPNTFDRYVGAYALPSGNTITFWREGAHIRSRISGQSAFENFPTSEHEYFMKAVDARWEFVPADNNAALSVILYQNGRTVVAKRLPDSEGQKRLDESLAIEKRFQEQVAMPGTAEAVQRLISGLATGAPHYEEMSPELAALTHDELPGLQKTLNGFGALQSLSFKGVEPNGVDRYDVTFNHVVREFRLRLDDKGRVDFAWFSP